MNLDELLQELKNLKEKEINLHTEIKNIKIKRDEINFFCSRIGFTQGGY